MTPLLLTVGNIYIDHNIFSVESGDSFTLLSGKDYFAQNGERVLGGSAVNAALQARKLGLDVGFVGKTGTDPAADEVRKLLQDAGIISELVYADPSQVTAMAVNLVDKHGEFIGVHYGDASRTLRAEDIDTDHPLFERCAAVYFGGTCKQKQVFSGASALFEQLRERGIKVFYDPNRFPVHEEFMDRSLLHTQLGCVDGYFPNQEELLQATGLDNVDAALEQVISTGVGFVAMKQGPKGCRIKSTTEDFVVDGKKVDVITTVGAGDCFNATFIAYLLEGADLHTCAEKAVAASALKVSKNIWPDRSVIENG